MMTNYYQADQVLQIILLVLSQLTVITLASGFILLFKRGCEKKKQVGVAALFFLNAVVYVWMQLNSRITGAEINVQLQVPCGVLLAVILLSLFYNIRVILDETKDRKTLSRTSIKEAFDNLPTGVCFFNEMGLPVLCNLAMNRFSFAVCGKDVQFITDLEGCLSDDFVPATGVKKEDKVFVFPNDSAWHLEKRNFTHENGENYTQFIVTDVTQLHEKVCSQGAQPKLLVAKHIQSGGSFLQFITGNKPSVLAA